MRSLFLSFSLAATLAAWGLPGDPAREFDKANALVDQGKFAQAVKIYDRLVQVPSAEYRALMARSVIYFDKLAKYPDAFTDVSRAMMLAPDSVAPYVTRAYFYNSARMPDRALEDLTVARAHCRNKEDSLSVFLNTGVSYGSMRRFEDAVYWYDQVLAIDPEHLGGLSNKAATLDDLDRDDEARAIYLELHRLLPNEIVILNNLGFQATRRGDHGDALNWFSMAQQIAPDDAVVLNNLGHAQLGVGRTDEALRNIQRSIKLYPGNSYAYRNLGLAWQAKGEKDKACAAFEAALARGYTAQYGTDVEQWRKDHCR